MGSQLSPTFYSSMGDDEAVIKASPGNLYSVYAAVQTEGEVALWLMFFNTAAEPVDGATPIAGANFPMMPPTADGVTGSGFYYPVIVGRDYLSENGMFFSTGIAWAISTTPATLTKPGASANITVNASYI